MLNMDLTEPVAVVFGATSGLCRTIALGIPEHGADVIPSGRRRERLDLVCPGIRERGNRTPVCACDG